MSLESGGCIAFIIPGSAFSESNRFLYFIIDVQFKVFLDQILRSSLAVYGGLGQLVMFMSNIKKNIKHNLTSLLKET